MNLFRLRGLNTWSWYGKAKINLAENNREGVEIFRFNALSAFSAFISSKS